MYCAFSEDGRRTCRQQRDEPPFLGVSGTRARCRMVARPAGRAWPMCAQWLASSLEGLGFVLQQQRPPPGIDEACVQCAPRGRGRCRAHLTAATRRLCLYASPAIRGAPTPMASWGRPTPSWRPVPAGSPAGAAVQYCGRVLAPKVGPPASRNDHSALGEGTGHLLPGPLASSGPPGCSVPL